MKIYLAHNFKARVWLRDYKKFLELKGHEVTSRWLTQSYPPDRTAYEEQQAALENLEDIDRADTLILFVDQYGDSPGKGKFMEFGYALAKGKKIYIHGQDKHSSVFYYLPQIRVLNLISDLADLPKEA